MGSRKKVLFSWVQNKLIGKQYGSNTQQPNIFPPNKFSRGDQKEEFSDWPNGLILTIGTLGTNKLAHKDQDDQSKDQNFLKKNSSQNEVQDLMSSEELKELQKELNTLISSELEKGDKTHHDDDNDQVEGSDQKHFASIMPSIINTKGRDVYLDHNSNTSGNKAMISKKSLSFLLKKMFVCGGGFGPTPSLRDPILSPGPKSRMEKILRAILQKKIHPQSPRRTMSSKKYLESRHAATNSDDDDDDEGIHGEGSEDGIKWLKTDDEYIVLEI